MHTHRSTMHTLVASMHWFAVPAGDDPAGRRAFVSCDRHAGRHERPAVQRQHGGAAAALGPRVAAAECVQRYRVGSWTAVPTMIQDFFMNPNIERYDLSSIRRLSGGGAAMPATVAQRLKDRGITFYEGYGLTETMAATHINPPGRAKQQCLGIPDLRSGLARDRSRRRWPRTAARERSARSSRTARRCSWATGTSPRTSAQAFLEIDGNRFLRTGDLGRVDEDGYFFMVDRLKRMINASGYKVWPSEVESLMYQHPAVLEACVIGTRTRTAARPSKPSSCFDAEWRGRVEEQAIIDWCRSAHGGVQGAAYHRLRRCAAQVGQRQDPCGASCRIARPPRRPNEVRAHESSA